MTTTGQTQNSPDTLTITVVGFGRRLVATLIDGLVSAGSHETVWDARAVPAGVYVCKTAIDGREGWSGKIVIGR